MSDYTIPSFEVFEDSVSAGIRFEYGVAREKNFKKIFEEYQNFIQRSDNAVQAWELCEGNAYSTSTSDFDSTKGVTFRINLKDSTTSNENDIATISSGKMKISKSSNKSNSCFYLSMNYFKDIDYNSYVDSGYTTDYHTGKPDNMINKGEYIPFTLHTLYDNGLYSCEQGGATCKNMFDYTTVTNEYPAYNYTKKNSNRANLVDDKNVTESDKHTTSPMLPRNRDTMVYLFRRGLKSI